MAEEEEGSEKPYEASPRKLEEARKRGEVPVSQDLITFGVYFGVLVVGAGFGVWSVQRAGQALTPFLAAPDELAESVFGVNGRFAYGGLIRHFVGGLSPWFLLPFICALAIAFLQGALVFAGQKLQPKLNRVSPLKNAKQKYGSDGMFNFAKSFVKLIIYGGVLALMFRSRLNEILGMSAMSLQGILWLAAELCFRFLAASALAIFGTTMIHYTWQRA